MTLTDTHTHIYMSDFDSDGGGEAAVRRALDAGVSRMVLPCVDLDSLPPMHRLFSQFPDNIRMAIG
ncbi:MAG: TatD family hydrolase, partial [Muribaculaceae bacterium]|nr:TatD family hydrolase [Muribaculaceae bacterium]